MVGNGRVKPRWGWLAKEGEEEGEIKVNELTNLESVALKKLAEKLPHEELVVALPIVSIAMFEGDAK